MKRTTVTCACGASMETTVPAGKSATCRACGQKVRVPLRKDDKMLRGFDCPECGKLIETTVLPGKQVTCRECEARVRVPLRDPSEAPAPDPDAPPRERRNWAEEKANETLGIESGGLSVGLGMGILMMVGAVLWFGWGLSVGIIWFYPPVLFVAGAISAGNALRRGRR